MQKVSNQSKELVYGDTSLNDIYLDNNNSDFTIMNPNSDLNFKSKKMPVTTVAPTTVDCSS